MLAAARALKEVETAASEAASEAGKAIMQTSGTHLNEKFDGCSDWTKNDIIKSLVPALVLLANSHTFNGTTDPIGCIIGALKSRAFAKECSDKGDITANNIANEVLCLDDDSNSKYLQAVRGAMIESWRTQRRERDFDGARRTLSLALEAHALHRR